MKSIVYVILLSFVFLGCQKGAEKTYNARSIKVEEDFNTYQKEKESPLSIYKTAGSKKDDFFGLKFRDTVVKIQGKKSVGSQFIFAAFINTQQTCLLVQLAPPVDPGSAFYLVCLKDGQLDVVSLERDSKGARDQQYTRGLDRLGNAGYIVNNDFYVSRVNAKVSLLKRENPEERIQGEFIMNSTDINTFVFLRAKDLFELHYPSGEVFIQPLSTKASSNAEAYKWIQENCHWVKNANGVSFLKASDPDRIIDMTRKIR